MCTVSWLYANGGYDVFCNRDEKRSRRRATAPRIAECGGVRYIAPIDGDHGGSWVAANECGVTVALLNGAPTHSPGRISRGSLVLQAIGATSAAAARTCVRDADLIAFAPFVLVAFDLTTRPCLLEWTGMRVIETAADTVMPLASSSYDPAGVRALRRRQFGQAIDSGISARTLNAFHASHDAGPSAYSPCMHRTDAATVSFSRITVSHRRLEFFYTPAPPCAHARGVTVTLPLQPRRSRAA